MVVISVLTTITAMLVISILTTAMTTTTLVMVVLLGVTIAAAVKYSTLVVNLIGKHIFLPLYSFFKTYKNLLFRIAVLEETLKLVSEVELNCLMGDSWTEDSLATEVQAIHSFFINNSEFDLAMKAAVTKEFKQYAREIYGFKHSHGHVAFGSNWE